MEGDEPFLRTKVMSTEIAHFLQRNFEKHCSLKRINESQRGLKCEMFLVKGETPGKNISVSKWVRSGERKFLPFQESQFFQKAFTSYRCRQLKRS